MSRSCETDIGGVVRMAEAHDTAGVRACVTQWRKRGETVALVPTMGNLHAGHLSLVRLASRVCDRVVVSIFVNPTQFGEGEDFSAYPRTLAADRTALIGAGVVDLVFVPDVRQIYPFGIDQAIRFVLPDLSRDLCGTTRPGHFDGVASVVCRLLNIVTPDCLVMGRKDYQQLVLLEWLIRDLALPVRIVSGMTCRDDDGLALSSRNQYLSDLERKRAPELHAVLEHVARSLREGHGTCGQLESEAVRVLAQSGFTPDYVQVRRRSDLSLPATEREPLVVLGAAWLGRARLIDNVEV